MNDTFDELVEQYTSALQDYLTGGGEAALHRAYELGRKAIADGLGVLEMATIHQKSLVTVLLHTLTPEESVRTAKMAVDFFSESLSPFEMTQLGFRETIARLRDLNETLALRSTELAAVNQELSQANTRLQEATRQAETASRHKSEFLANMSHELRTPLNSVIGFSELLLERTVGPMNEKQTRFLTNIQNSGKHLLQLISDILDLSKVEAGKFVLQPEPLPVAEALEDILVLARGLAHKKAQTVEAEIDPELPPLRADPVRFKQILFNLLSNAIKFTPDGGRVTVTARRVRGAESGVRSGVDSTPHVARRTSDPGEFVKIAVQDSGIGIKAEDLPRLFQEFVQLEATATKRNEGTGLGLALTRRLVELHGGRIWAESAGEGRGTTVTVVLPFAGPGEVPEGQAS